ncbi:unnamed protein product [Cuscuta epithymum]|uniref:Uncharacterized protein n=1 Tax=Cuscuta epithymum TaxID=186058 RepID=A0AAV0EJZ6_9ASTE|nr:unnamed protein product [Cuscuta epithymum]
MFGYFVFHLPHARVFFFFFADVPDMLEKFVIGGESDEEEAQPVVILTTPRAAMGKEHGAPSDRASQIPRRVRIAFSPQSAVPVKEKQKRNIIDQLVDLDGSDDEEEEFSQLLPMWPLRPLWG